MQGSREGKSEECHVLLFLLNSLNCNSIFITMITNSFNDIHSPIEQTTTEFLKYRPTYKISIFFVIFFVCNTAVDVEPEGSWRRARPDRQDEGFSLCCCENTHSRTHAHTHTSLYTVVMLQQDPNSLLLFFSVLFCF